MIAIVGGGITGLALGWELQRRNADFVVLESDGEPGGVIRSREIDGLVLDFGPQRTRATPAIRAIVEELGLRQEIVTAPADLDLFVYARGRLRRVPFGVGGMLASDLVSKWAKARAALEPFTRGPADAERVDAFFRRKLGRELYEVLIGPLYGGLYASDPADMEVGLSLGRVLRELGVGRSLLLSLLRRGGRLDPPPACTFRAGMQALPRTLGARLGRRLRLSTAVRTLRPSGSGWQLATDEGLIEASSVVLTTPADVTARILTDAAPLTAAALRQLRYNPLAVVHLEAETDLRGLGFQVSFTERDMMLRGVTFNASLFGRGRLYTAFTGGAHRPEIVSVADADVARRTVDELRRCTGHGARVLSVARQRVPAWDVSWHALDELRSPQGIHLAGSWRSRPGIPGRLAEAERLATALAGP